MTCTVPGIYSAVMTIKQNILALMEFTFYWDNRQGVCSKSYRIQTQTVQFQTCPRPNGLLSFLPASIL